VKIGVPKEIINNEYRVSVVPGGVYELIKDGNTFYLQSSAVVGSGYEDSEYIKAGAVILDKVEDIYKNAELIVKVKEPVEKEYRLIKEGQLIFAYFHLSSNRKLTKALISSGASFIAYETIEKDGKFPLLATMSEIAGREAAIMGAYYLGVQFGGGGSFISGTTGILPCRVLIIGAGIVGKSAARMMSGMGADVIIMSPFIDELREIELGNYFNSNVSTKVMSYYNIIEEIKKADVLISAVYVKGGRTPLLVTKDMVSKMKKGSVIVAVDIDQGSSIETAHPTTHQDPVYVDYGVIHYCVANMPGVFPRTSTLALTNISLPYIKKIAKGGIKAVISDIELVTGLNVHKGKIVYLKIAKDLDMMDDYEELL